MKYTVKPTAQFQRDYRRAMERGRDMEPLKAVIAALAAGETLPRENRDRPLAGRWAGYRECQVSPDQLLIYRIDGDILVLTLTRTGTVTELYGKGGTAMKKSTSLRMLLRSPVKTAVTLLLIAAASFLFLYNLLDYAMTKREYDRTYSAYHGYFSLRTPEVQVHNDRWGLASKPYFFVSDEKANPAYDGSRYAYDNYHQPDLEAETVERVLALPYVEYASPRYMTAGQSEYKRIFTYCLDWDLSFFNYGERLVVEGTLEGISSDCFNMSSGFGNRGEGYTLALTLGDVRVLAGEEEDLRKSRYYTEKNKLNVETRVLTAEEPTGILYAATTHLEGQRFAAAFCRNTFTPEDIEGLELGQRYVACIVTDPISNSNYADGLNPDTYLMEKNPDPQTLFSSSLYYPYAFFADETIYGIWPYLYSLEGQPENYLETEEFAPLRQIMQVMNTDESTLDVHYTEDMGNIRRYLEGKLLPVQGRMLARSDTENRNPVCVIPDTFAEKYGLSLGDTLHLELGDKLLEQYAPMGAIAYSTERYAENWTGQDFTVVGTYAEMGLDKLSDEDQYWAYGENAVFVPLSFLPETADVENHALKPSELSFVIPEADNIRPFMEECIPQLEAMGWKVYFFDGNWPAVEEQLHQADRLSLVKLSAFAFSAVLVLWLTVYLYILRKKKEFAVMRALGCPAGEAQKALLFPLLVLAAPAVVLGSIGAMLYTRRAAEANAAEFAVLGLAMDTAIPVPILLAGFCGSLALLLLLAAAALRRVAKAPPLELIQGSNGGRAPRKQTAQPLEPAEHTVYGELRALPEPAYRSHTALRHTLSYVWRHLRRTPFKALLSLLLALVLAFAIGFFTLLRNTYRDLYQNIEIHPRFVNGFSYTRAKEVEKTDYVRDPYYAYMDTTCESNFVKDTLVLSSDFDRVCDAEITWREGKERRDLEKQSNFCVISRDLAEELGYTLGSTLELTSLNRLNYLAMSMPYLGYEELVETYHKQASKLYVIGIAEETGKRIYAHVQNWERCSSAIGLSYLPLDLAEYTLNDYHKATEFRSYAWRQTSGTAARFSMETAEADRVYQTYRLLELLYPIAFALALILGCVLPGGIILQSAREAALLRVLGTTKRRTRAMLTLEQIFLCFLGLCLAVAALVIAKGSALTAVAGLIAVYIAAHLLACAMGTEAAAVSVTRRNVLELLQVKE